MRSGRHPALTPCLANWEVIITDKDVTSLGLEKETSFPYQIISASSDECIIRKSDGSVDRYGRDGDDIYVLSSGGAHIKVFLKRKS